MKLYGFVISENCCYKMVDIFFCIVNIYMDKILRDDIKIMTEYENIKGKIAQVLTLNYLRDKYKNKNLHVHVYTEVINDIDVFDKEIDIKTLSATKPTIETFLGVLSEESINLLESYEVKFVKELCFKNLVQIITKSTYQPNTELKLMFIPNWKTIGNELNDIINTFNTYKSIIVNLHDENKYKVFNYLINETINYNKPINNVINNTLKQLLNDTIRTNFKHNLTVDQYKIILNNFNNFTIEILTKQELSNISLSPDLVAELLDYNDNDTIITKDRFTGM